MNTYCGWTIMGRTGEGCSASEVLLSLHVRDLKICDLWSLDSLGIKEPSISQSKSEIEEAVKDYFVRSLRRDDEGRYQVSLPWLAVHPELSDNRNIAERRLKSCVRFLQKRNILQEYENIFKEWVSEKIIESVEPENLLGKRAISYHIDPSLKKIPPLEFAQYLMRQPRKKSGSLNDCIEKGLIIWN
ncbi:DUF1758 domain-containing protein [Trichonephila clavata]|uniref:DUF1758 domain-containing protein n=1 Tax=Trichonephila clavata TaxID=2740835 RepID=A0A8X6J5U4_TRICU|nr:DUF1758 domain-containing protein [Trichonephila clavata]